jgi:hypothetical protein
MFEKEELVVDLLALAHFDELLLELQRVFVRDEVESVNLTAAHGPAQRVSVAK